MSEATDNLEKKWDDKWEDNKDDKMRELELKIKNEIETYINLTKK